MRVLVTGDHTRTGYDDRMWLYAGLNVLHKMTPITELIEGGAPGFDSHGANWALWRQACGDTIKHTPVPADWTTHGKAAGPIRNTKMARLRPDVVLECPGGPGTANMVATAKAHGLRVIQLIKMPVAAPTKRGTAPDPPPPVVVIDA